ncbi:MAG TPA: nucleoside-diphosphate sugar epimerase/dehydratase [Burkholderiaceae bacterium]|jgi:FlaA1/EpsC-like NDP-sugar epimerase|nr:nucleoside-diphosphate sugar epimerase/dehydratase [Burkholderiaceae bacterium]
MLWLTLDAFLTRVRPQRERLSLLLDAVVVALAWQATYLFRLGFRYWLVERPRYDTAVLAGLVLLYVVVLWLFKVPKGMWRFSGFGEVKRVAGACALAGLVGATIVLMAHLSGIPRAVLALHPVFCVIGLATTRIGYRMLYEHMRGRISGTAQETHRALVMGAGQAGRLAVAGIQHQGFTVVGWLDDDPAKAGARVAGIPVIGRLVDAPAMSQLHGITHLIVAMPAADRRARRRALDIAGDTGLHVLTVPSSEELLHGRRADEVREIEPEDLLGREPVKLDEQGIDLTLHGKTVLITGAGGSIGSELCRQVARYRPARLVLVELSEFNLYTIEQELGQLFPGLELVRLICDVKDLPGLRRICSAWTPHVVFHAAAYKHVPLMEEHNAWAALRNNTLGTYNAALAAGESGAERFVLISTDKAVNPTNVMGATKRAAEMVVSSLVPDFPATRFMAVRFGNVLGSSGSVIPKFKEQIARGGPITVTHPDIIRYFMTIPEAARLVIQAAAIGESGQVLVLDMGEPVKIVDLARDMIKLSGHSVDDIRIVFTGLRPGEKLYEELLADADATIPTAIAQLRIAKLEARSASVAGLLQRAAAAAAFDDTAVREELRQVVPEYRPA